MKSREELRDLMACVDAEVGRAIKSKLKVQADIAIPVVISLISILQIGCRSSEAIDFDALKPAKALIDDLREGFKGYPAIQELIDEGWSQPVDVWDDYTGN